MTVGKQPEHFALLWAIPNLTAAWKTFSFGPVLPESSCPPTHPTTALPLLHLLFPFSSTYPSHTGFIYSSRKLITTLILFPSCCCFLKSFFPPIFPLLFPSLHLGVCLIRPTQRPSLSHDLHRPLYHSEPPISPHYCSWLLLLTRNTF